MRENEFDINETNLFKFLTPCKSHKYLFQESLQLQFGTYSGEVEDGKPSGKGSVTFNSDDIQVGTSLLQSDSFTQIFIQERKTFTGNWVNGKREGPGKMIWCNGEEYNGEWKSNLQVRFFSNFFANFIT